ncbi:MAG TPA: methyltransferase regulatory domain-containing protein [Chlorobaculum sp.]|nr:methyltransferase regulatory domain-containing protein [Chlorobaculum sp.]
MTVDWTFGYVADIDYTYGYYSELNPLRVKLAFLNAGLVFPEFGTACELGFGQGMSANIHASSSSTKWYGTDFNPAQASFAADMATISDSGAKLYDESFLEFAERADLPDFDYIGLHGVWSWISDENRNIIVKFLRRKLKVGGVLYISYNTMPGWASFAPMRHLMTRHAEVIGVDGQGIVKRIAGAVDFADKLLATNPVFARANPQVTERLTTMKGYNAHYLAHEYFNRDWLPMHFASMAEWLTSAKLDYACSANYLDHVDAVNHTAEQQAFLNEIPDLMFRQSVRDFMVNQQFRKDYWVKGARKLSILERLEALRKLKIILLKDRSDVSLKVTGAIGESSMSEAVYSPILDLLFDHKPKTLGEIEIALRDKGINFTQLVEAVVLLSGVGHLAAVQEDDLAITKAKQHTDKVNAFIIDKARGGAEINFLASPVIGGGVAVGRFHQLFILALNQGRKTPVAQAEFAWQILVSQAQKIVKDGNVLETPEENLAELTAQASVFTEKQMPILTALQVV